MAARAHLPCTIASRELTRTSPLAAPLRAGAGKTHTMIGDRVTGPGVMVLAMEDLFAAIESTALDSSFELQLTYLEVRPSADCLPPVYCPLPKTLSACLRCSLSAQICDLSAPIYQLTSASWLSASAAIPGKLFSHLSVLYHLWSSNYLTYPIPI
jgi:hypothetical protein